jgi:hypothetical protein
MVSEVDASGNWGILRAGAGGGGMAGNSASNDCECN